VNNIVSEIYFLGIDGVGKTTICRKIIENYSRKKIKIAWVRTQHTLAYLIALILYKLGYNYFIRGSTDSEFYLDPRFLTLKKTWSLIEFISVIPIIIKYKIYSMAGYTIIFDRSLLDTIIQNRFFLYPYFNFYEKILLKFIQNKKGIYLYADYHNVIKRKKNLFWPKAFLLFQIQQFNQFTRLLSISIIDTRNKNIKEVIYEVRNIM